MEINDYESDIQFGNWLRDERQKAGLTIEKAAEMAGLDPERLQALESGSANKGITQRESQSLSQTYSLDLGELIRRATGEV